MKFATCACGMRRVANLILARNKKKSKAAYLIAHADGFSLVINSQTSLRSFYEEATMCRGRLASIR